MSISSIGANSLNWLQQATRSMTRSNVSGDGTQSFQDRDSTVSSPSKALFSELDQDVSGALDSTEFQLFVDKLNEQTGQSLDSETLLTSYDEDGDGTLSGMEMDALLEENLPEAESVAQTSLSDLFSELDEDGDATLSSSEFEALVSMINEATGSELDSDSLLEAYDEDGDGLLSEAETIAALEANRPDGPPPPPSESEDLLSELFNELDEDGDATLNNSEIETLVTMMNDASGSEFDSDSLLEAYDEDGDGLLSEAETLAALEANRPQGPPPSSVASTEDDDAIDETSATDETTETSTAQSVLQSQLEELMVSYDADGDGALSEDELLSLFDDAMAASAAQRADMEQSRQVAEHYQTMEARFSGPPQAPVGSAGMNDAISIEA
nr:EF-hand domain-containing protein [uncultured Desulfuromonas sp.]